MSIKSLQSIVDQHGLLLSPGQLFALEHAIGLLSSPVVPGIELGMLDDPEWVTVIMNKQEKMSVVTLDVGDDRIPDLCRILAV